MISEIISSKEQTIMGRNRFTNVIYMTTLVVMLVAIFLSWQRIDTFERERISAVADDHEEEAEEDFNLNDKQLQELLFIHEKKGL